MIVMRSVKYKIHLKGFRTVNPALQDIKSILYVVYSDHPDYNVGDEHVYTGWG